MHFMKQISAVTSTNCMVALLTVSIYSIIFPHFMCYLFANEQCFILKTDGRLCISGLPYAACSPFVTPGQCYKFTWFAGTFAWTAVLCQSKEL